MPWNKTNTILLVCGICLFAAILGGLIAALVLEPDSTDDDEGESSSRPMDRDSRIDCFPEWLLDNANDSSQAECQSRTGCVYEPWEGPETGIPPCFLDPDTGYHVVGGREDLDNGFRYDLKVRTVGTGIKTQTVEDIAFEVRYRDESSLRFKFYDPAIERYEVPKEILDIPDGEDDVDEDDILYEVEVTSNNPFQFRVVRKDTGHALWDTSVGGLVFEDQFLTISTKLPSDNVYGFGENTHRSYKHDMNYRTWGMFSRDQPVGAVYENHYSVHPFYMALEPDGNSHGVLLLNSNAQDYTMAPSPMLTYRTVGGILDFYMFVGPSPENVVQQYTAAIGRPYLPPYWSLGFHLCRYGYNTLGNLQAAVERTAAADLPHDVQYADIDHMDERKVFTIDQDNFAGLPDYFQELRQGGMRTFIILDPFLITNETGYAPYDRMNAEDAFVKWPNGTTMEAVCWPDGPVAYPDFFMAEARDIWKELIIEHRTNDLEYDGLWLDMNEPAAFSTNEEKAWNWPGDVTFTLKCPDSSLDDPPYRTMASFAYDHGQLNNPNRNSLARLSDKTLCMVGQQTDGVKVYNQYDVHSLYGINMLQPSLDALREAIYDESGQNERSFVFTRSSFPGTGHQSGRWLGDNTSGWRDLREAIIGMMETSLFGIPFIGADICGFFEDTTPQLCKRWLQVGAFYPFSRSHNGIDYVDQDPGVFDEDVIEAFRHAITIRYELLPFLYTLFYNAHQHGDTVLRPLLHEFPKDSTTYNIDEQFLWGKSFLVSPILYENQTELQYYLPADRWYDYDTGEMVESQGQTYTQDVYPNSTITLHIRAGNILPTQEPARNTTHSRQNPFGVIVALDGEGEATGEMFWDDGVTIDTVTGGLFNFYEFTISEGELVMHETEGGGPDMPTLETARILGVETEVTEVFVNGTDHTDFEWDDTSQTLLITSMALSMDGGESWTVSWE